jgi:hypothetical protein
LYRLHKEDASETVDWPPRERRLPAYEAICEARRIAFGCSSMRLNSTWLTIEEASDGSFWRIMRVVYSASDVSNDDSRSIVKAGGAEVSRAALQARPEDHPPL